MAYFEGGFGTLRETAAHGQAGSPFHLARSVAGRAAPRFADLITPADSADAVVATVIAAGGGFHPIG